jgi:hypothetical protein
MQPNEIVVIDNFISVQTQDFISQQLQAATVPWEFLPDVTQRPEAVDTEKNIGFGHAVFVNNTVVSMSYWFLYPVLLEACSKQNVNVNQLLRIRLGLYVNTNSSKANKRHTDQKDPHLVGLYYVDDSDGDTVFYKDDISDEEIMRCAPKKGRMVLFDGLIYHASTSPVKKTHRMTVNFNFLSEE